MTTLLSGEAIIWNSPAAWKLNGTPSPVRRCGSPYPQFDVQVSPAGWPGRGCFTGSLNDGGKEGSSNGGFQGIHFWISSGGQLVPFGTHMGAGAPGGNLIVPLYVSVAPTHW